MNEGDRLIEAAEPGKHHRWSSVTAPCQFNGGFVITDGFATSGGPGGYGNTDNAAPGVNAFTKQFKEDPAIVLQDPYRDTW